MLGQSKRCGSKRCRGTKKTKWKEFGHHSFILDIPVARLSPTTWELPRPLGWSRPPRPRIDLPRGGKSVTLDNDEIFGPLDEGFDACRTSSCRFSIPSHSDFGCDCGWCIWKGIASTWNKKSVLKSNADYEYRVVNCDAINGKFIRFKFYFFCKYWDRVSKQRPPNWRYPCSNPKFRKEKSNYFK